MSSQTWRRNWVSDKCAVAGRLSRGEAGGGYAESVILVCATLSALSAELWVGRNIDRVRFIEMLVKFGRNSNESALQNRYTPHEHSLSGVNLASEIP